MNKLDIKFAELFGSGNKPQRFFCPGRVNLIGEHIDYLGGLVMPAAISLGITGLIRPTTSDRVRLFSTDFDNTVEFDATSLPDKKQGAWSDYVLGVILFLKKKGIPIRGFDLLIDSSLPKGSGLSSSAALEVLIYYSLSKLFADLEPDRTQMALDCQQIENEFIGVNCGIMDQFAVANGKKDHAIKLNCNSLDFQQIPLNLGEYSLLIINSNKPRQLAESAYNQRRSECDEALRILQQKNPSLANLVDADLSETEAIENPVIRQRAKHAITEQLRVKQSAKALAQNDLETFGKLMNASHTSLSEDFEVSCDELEFIVSHLQLEKGCLGIRMTGAGFGGCCIAVIQTHRLSDTAKKLEIQYRNQFGYTPSFYSCQPSDGVRMLVED